MKILYIAGASHHGGASTALLNIVLNIREHAEVTVVFSRHGIISQQLENEGVKCVYIHLTSYHYPQFKSFRDFVFYIPRAMRSLIRDIISRMFLCRYVRQFTPDIIHTNMGTLHIGDYLSRRFGISHVWHIRENQRSIGINIFPSEQNFMTKLKRVNNYPIAITKAVYNYYEMGNNAVVIYDGVIKDTQYPIIKYEVSRYFLFVGTVSTPKGADFLLDAFIDFAQKNDDVELWFAGVGSKAFITQMSERVVSNHLENRVKFLGYRSDVYNLMANALAIVTSSLFEGFGFTTVEAMYNGCLVIGNNTAGTKEQFDNGLELTGKDIGIRYSTHDDLTLALTNVAINGKKHYKSMIENAQSVVCQLYTIKKNINSIIGLYNKILKQ